MKQGGHFIVGQQRRPPATGRAEVAGQEGHGPLQAAIGATPADKAVRHPGPASLVLAGEGGEVEGGHLFVPAEEGKIEAFLMAKKGRARSRGKETDKSREAE